MRYASLSYGSLVCASSLWGAKAVSAGSTLPISSDLRLLLEQVVDTILPKDSSPGALELKVPDFVVTMATDCMEEKDQKDFLQGLSSLNAYVKAQHGKPFTELNQTEREGVLREILKANKNPEGSKVDVRVLKAFISRTKSLTVEGYMKSEYVMTQVFPYVQIPGPYQPSVPIAQAKF